MLFLQGLCLQEQWLLSMVAGALQERLGQATPAPATEQQLAMRRKQNVVMAHPGFMNMLREYLVKLIALRRLPVQRPTVRKELGTVMTDP